jgi:hypothetical protein
MSFIYNADARAQVEAWLDVAATLPTWGPACVMWLLGPDGIGKASLIRECVASAQRDWELSVLDPHTYANASAVVDQVSKICNTQSFTSAFEGVRRVRAVLLDDLDVFVSSDRGFFGGFTECLKYAHWRGVPCICIGTLALERRIRELRKGSIILMPAPMAKEISAWKPGASASAVHECAGNMAYLSLLGNGPCEQQMDRVIGLDKMLMGEATVTEMRRLFAEDPLFVTLRMHENMHEELFANRRASVAVKARVYADILDVLLTWDALVLAEPELACEMVFCAYGVLMGKLPRLKAALAPKAAFTKVLSHLSLQKKNKRMQFDVLPFGYPGKNL